MIYQVCKRIFDLVSAIGAFIVFFIPMVIIGIIIRVTSPGPAIHWSERVGRYNRRFRMAKFRTMRIDTPQVATHLIEDPASYVTQTGKFLRKYSLDELPQLINIIKGDLSVVGPRPALFNQDDLIALRTEKGIHTIKPGLTGWAQINGRDELPIPVKVRYDEHYFSHFSFFFDLKIIFLTLVKTIKGDGITH